MKLYRSTAAVLLITAAQLFAQDMTAQSGAAPSMTPTVPASTYPRPLRMPMGSRNPGANISTPITLRQRVDEMESTLDKMHEALEQMRKKATVSRDSATSANLQLWTLMVTHLDGELKDLKVTMALREDIDARRAAMYQQAGAKGQGQAAIAARRFAIPQTPAVQEAPAAPAALPGTAPEPK